MPTSPAPNQGAQQASPAAVSFIDGSYEYSEIMYSGTFTPGAAVTDLPVIPITPGGFLRGVSIYVTSANGVLGTSVVSPDGPFNLFSSISLESVDGTPILYPMGGYAYALLEDLARPWGLSPFNDSDTSNTVNPAFRMMISNELRATLGVLPNTDARSQYRLRISLNSLTGWLKTYVESGFTAPDVTITVALETYAQPPAKTLTGAPIAQLPDGLAVQRFYSHQVISGLSASDNTLQVTRTGNLVRSHILVFRDDTGARVDLTTDPIRMRVDNTQMFVEQRARRDFIDSAFASSFSGGAQRTRPTGVYFSPHFQGVGNMIGQAWLATTAATFLEYEVLGAPAAGSVEIITEDLAPKASQVPAYLENI